MERLNAIKETLRSGFPISENDIKWITKTINEKGYESINGLSFPIKLDIESNQKRYNWLWNLYKSSTGKIRKNNPFCDLIINALNNFSHIKIISFCNITYNGNRWYFIPIYKVYTKKGFGFQYRVIDNKIQLVG